MIPGLINNVLSIVDAIKGDPATPEEAKAELDALSQRLAEVVVRVKAVKFPGA